MIVEKTAFEELREICEVRGLQLVEEKHILNGEGIIVDSAHNLVVVSFNAPLTDIQNVIKFIEDLTTL